MADSVPDWRPQYEAAILETDVFKLLEKIKAAEEAIRRHCESLDDDSPGSEVIELANAMTTLGTLRRERLGESR
jgi:hypothetical protein